MDGARQVLQPIQFELQLFSSGRCEPVRLFIARGVFQLESLDPAILEEPSESAEERAGAQADASLADRFDIFDQRITMTRRLRETHQDEKNRLRDGFV